MHISVMPFFNKMRMLGKIIFPAVFQDKVPLAAQDGLFSVKNLVRKGIQAFQLIWWICKYEVKSTVAELQEVEHVAVDRPDFFQAEAFVHLAYKGGVFPVHFHAYSFTSSSGDEFSAYASCPSKKIQEAESFKFIFAFQDVEQAFLGKVSRRSGRIACWRIYGFTLESSSDNSHFRIFVSGPVTFSALRL